METPAPNKEGGMGDEDKGMNGFRGGLAAYNKQRRSLKNPNPTDRAQTDSQGTGDRTPEHISEQLTLSKTLQPNLGQLEQGKGNYGILAHGPPCQGPRTLLIIQGER